MFTIRLRHPFSGTIPLIVLCFSLTLAGAARAADGITSAERQVVEQTIRQQLDAFAHDDADRAFGFATPEIQRMFGSADRFLAMVRDHYEPVYRPSGVQFGRLERVEKQWVQTVKITDDGGRVWRALFTMQRLPDKSWKVGGCQLEETDSVAI